jgi:HEPN superfamily protein
MPSADEVYQDIELDRSLRENEIRLIENIAARTENETERNMLRRSVVLLTYAHLEGSCKFSLSAYAVALNALALPCQEAATALVAATLGKIFAALRDLNSKHPDFGRALPEDRELHLLARERAFLDEYNTIVGRHVEIPDRLIDTKSNLNSIVLNPHSSDEAAILSALVAPLD